MKRRVCLDDLLVEALEANLPVPTLLSMNRGGERIGIGQREPCTNPHGGCASRECEINLNRLDTETDEHCVDGVGSCGAGIAQRADQHLRVVDRRDHAACSRLEGTAHPLNPLGVIGVVAAEVCDQDVGVKNDYGHWRRSSSR